MKIIRILTIVLLIFFIGNFCYADNTATKEEWPAYLLSIFIGYGTGHFYLGDENARNFLLGEILGQAVIIGGIVFLYYRMASTDLYTESDPFAAIDDFFLSYSIIIGGGLLTAIVHIWEIVDVFGAVERARDAGKIAVVQPFIDIQPARTGLGLSLRY